MNNRWLPTNDESSFIPLDLISTSITECPPLHSESKTVALTTFKKPTTTQNTYIPKYVIPQESHHHLDHYYYHQLHQQISSNNINITNQEETSEQPETMNVYYYKQQLENQSTDASKLNSRGCSEFDEVVQQSSSLESSKKEIIEDKEKSILFCGFNQLNNLFSVGTEQGFYVYSTGNLRERTKMCK